MNKKFICKGGRQSFLREKKKVYVLRKGEGKKYGENFLLTQTFQTGEKQSAANVGAERLKYQQLLIKR